MTVPSDTGYVDYTEKGAIPTVGTADVSQSVPDTTNLAVNSRVYTDKPYVSNPQTWGKNGYYMNGPHFDPLNRANGLYSQIVALSESWNEPKKQQSLNNYFTLLSKYGHTNSAGTLWALASNDLPADRGLGQQILAHDSKVVAEENGQSAPALAASPATTPEASWAEKMWAPLQFQARNAFAVLSMPLETIQSSMRTIGGNIANPNLSVGEKIGRTALTLGSVASPLVSIPNSINFLASENATGDNPFVSPFEQTEFGQTIRAALNGEGFDAFTSAQGGLDIQKAKDELLLDPANKELTTSAEGLDRLDFLATEYAKKNNYYARPGWFVEENSRVGEAARRQAFTAWAIPGPDENLTAWTIGRGITSAVMGPDSSSYGIASGLIDAVAAIGLDPLSYAGVGFVSKGAKLVSGGRLLFGKALAEELAKGTPARASLEKAAVAMGYPLEEVARWDLPQQIQLVHDYKVADLTGNAIAALGVDTGMVSNLARSTRRNFINLSRAQKFHDSRIQYVAHDGTETESLALLDRYIMGMWRTDSSGNKVYDSDSYYNFMNNLVGNPNEGPIDFKTKALFDDLMQTYQLQRKGGDPDSYDNIIAFRNTLAEQSAKTVSSEFKTPKHLPIDRVERDAARIYTNPELDKEIEYLGRQDLVGANSIDPFTPDTAVLSSVDGVIAVSYLSGKAPLVYAAAADTVPEVARVSILKKLEAAADNPDLKLTTAPDETVSLAGQVASEIHSLIDLTPKLKALREAPSVTWGELLSSARDMGLDGILDDAIRTLPKKYRADGISGTAKIDGKGHWIGDHPRLLSYRVPKNASEFGTQSRNADNLEEVLATMPISGRNLAPIGLQSTTKKNVQRLYNSSMTRFTEQSADLAGYTADNVTNAIVRQRALDDDITKMSEGFTDPETALRQTIGYHLGMRNSRTGGITLDEKQVRLGLFGNGPFSFLINKTFDTLANFIPESRRKSALEKLANGDSSEYDTLMEQATADLLEITKNSWDLDAYRAVAANAIMGGGRDGLVDVLGPRMGVSVKMGSISKTITPAAQDGKTFFRTWRTTNPAVNRALDFGEKVSDRALAAVPKTQSISVSNTSQVIDAARAYMTYAKVDPAEIARLIGKAIMADGKVGSTVANRNLIAQSFNVISDHFVNKIEEVTGNSRLFKGATGQQRKTDMINAARETTRIWIGGMTKGSSEARARYATQSDVPVFTLGDGTMVPLPSYMLETELATGFITLPGVDEWTKMLTRVGISSQYFPKGTSIYDTSMRIFDNYFRTAMLAFRISYGIRNSAEMQIRIFMNGHSSILNDPFTMVGMAIGNQVAAKRARKYAERRAALGDELKFSLGRNPTREEVDNIAGTPPKDSAWVRLFTPYKDNAYGSAWEVGVDEQLAALNHAEDFMSITRTARSLNDYRVNNAAARQGWIPVAFDPKSPTFFKGWAHELFMLERSGFVKLVLGTESREPATLLGTVGQYDSRDAAVDWLMHNADAADLRSQMIESNPDFGKIFADKAATMDYLFSNPNSVYNRINDYTGGSTELKNFLRDGTLVYGLNDRFTPRYLTTMEDRWKGLSTILQKHFNTDQMAEHFVSRNVHVPWVDRQKPVEGNVLVNWFFDVTNKFERLGSVGPEFRMAYWDKFAEFAPALRQQDIDRALRSARTTLGPIKRVFKDGRFDKIGRNHAAFDALDSAKKNNVDGLLTLDEVHSIAAMHAAEETAKLFYDAAKRNNFWNSARILFPFGQAWGNTLKTWGELGAKKPINIYKAQKAFNAMLESGSSAIYDFGSDIGAYGQYAPGFAPWEQDSNGGFFYTDSYGETSFMYPLIGRVAAVPLNVLNAMSGNGWAGIQDYGVQSPAASLNLALGGENSIFPGVGPLAALPLSSGILPDNELTASIRQLAAPFGEKSALESAIPAWFSKMIAGTGSLPLIGDVLGPFADGLSPMNKSKNIKDSMMILSNSGNYPDWATNPETHRKLVDDASRLAKAMLLTTGLLQNFSPSTPYMQTSTSLSGDMFKGALETENTALYTVGMLNTVFQQYRKRNAYDDSAAREEFVRDFGPGTLFATTGDWVGMSRIPTSQALQFARSNPQIAKDNWDTFTLFFPQGDSSDVANVMWVKKNGFGDRVRKNPEEIYDEIISYLQRVQLYRVQSMEANGLINADQSQVVRDEITERYLATGTTVGTYVNKSDEMNRLNEFVSSYAEIQNSNAGQAFMSAWSARDYALQQARYQTGRERVTLSGNDVVNIKDWYLGKIDEISAQYPDFVLLANKFRKEWD